MAERDDEGGRPSPGGDDLQQQIDALRAQVTVNRSDIDHLQDTGRIDHALLEVLREEGASQMALNENLRQALVSSRRIGAAVGIVMCQRLLTEEAAFEMLRTISQNTNMKLRDIADRVVETGIVPDAASK